MKRFLLCLGLLVVLAGCESSKTSTGAAPMTYDQAVRELRRPPTESKVTSEGDLIATWETEVSEGTRRLTMRFDRQRVLQESNVTTVPRRR